MAKYCSNCREFKGNVRTCALCRNPVCSDCRVSGSVCKDCYLTKNKEEIMGEYYNDKNKDVISC